MRVRDLTRNFGGHLFLARQFRRGRRNVCDEIGELRYKHHPQQDTGDVEGDVYDSRPHCFGRFADGREDCGYTGSDVGTEGQRDARRQGNQAFGRHHDGDARGCRGRLYQAGEHRTDQDTQYGVLHLHHQVQERLVAAHRVHGFAHDAHAVENKAQAHDHAAVMSRTVRFCGKQHEKAHGHEQQCILRHVECNDLGSKGTADVCAHDHANRLRQRHKTGRYETDDENRCNGRGIEHRGNERAGDCTQETVFCQAGKHILELLTGRRLQAVRHLLHAVEKHRQPAKQCHGQVEPVDLGHSTVVRERRACEQRENGSGDYLEQPAAVGLDCLDHFSVEKPCQPLNQIPVPVSCQISRQAAQSCTA